VVLITHDLGVVAESCEEVVVMYAGRVVERAPVEALFAQPRHPYTAGLLASIPSAGERAEQGGERRRLRAIPGRVPGLTERPQGCRFRDRCDRATAACETLPPLVEKAPGHQVACHHPLEVRP
jgi:peptide/nickel transport system ATP-binding protein